MCLCLHMPSQYFVFGSPPLKTVPKQSNPSDHSIGYVPINKLSQAAIDTIDPLINS